MAATVLGLLGLRLVVQQRVLPQVETGLSQALGRDVTLGNPRIVLPWHVSLGKSEVKEFATLRGVGIDLNLWRLLWQRQLAIAVTLQEPNVTLKQGKDGAWVNFAKQEGGGEMPIPLGAVTVRLRDGEVTAIPQQGKPLTLNHLQANTRIDWETATDQAVEFDARARLENSSLEVEGQAQLPEQNVEVLLNGSKVPIAPLSSFLPSLPVSAQSGFADLDLQVGLTPKSPLALAGTVRLSDGMATLAALDAPFNELDATVNLDGQSAVLESAKGKLGQVPFQSEGRVNWLDALPSQPSNASPTSNSTQTPSGFDLDVQVERVEVPALLETFGIAVPVPVAGAATSQLAITGPLDQPRIDGSFTSLGMGRVDRVSVADFQGEFALVGTELRFPKLTAQLGTEKLKDGALRALGSVQLQAVPRTQMQFEAIGVDAAAIAARYGAKNLPVSVGTVDAQGRVQVVGAEPTLTADWQARNGEVTGTGKFAVRDGAIAVPEAQLALGNGKAKLAAKAVLPTPERAKAPVNAQLQFNGLNVGRFVPNQSGLADGTLTLKGSMADPSLTGIRLQGEVAFPEGVGPLSGAIASDVAWDGRALILANGRALSGVTFAGRIPINPETQTVGSLDLDINARNQPLPQLPYFPQNLPVQGQANLQARVTGKPDALKLDGRLGLQGLQAAGLRFSELAGPLQWSPETGATVDLQGSSRAGNASPDRLALQLRPDFSPESFMLRQGATEASGDRANNQFDIDLKRLPLALLNAAAPGGFGGTVDGNLRVNLTDYASSGRFAAKQPSWAGIRLRQLQGNFDYDRNRLSLADTQLVLASSVFQIEGDVTLPPAENESPENLSPSFDLKVKTGGALIHEILSTLRWQDWSDMAAGFELPQYGPARNLTVPALNVVPRSLYDRMESFAAIVKQRAELAAAQVDPRIPPPSSLRGLFLGEINLTGTLTDPSLAFNLEGLRWSLDEFQLDSLQMKGAYKDRVLTLEPFSARYRDRVGSFQGQVGLDAQSGTLEVTDFPITLLQRFVPQAPPFGGDLDVTAELQGNLRDPQVMGNLALANGQLNDEPLARIGTQFDYRNGVLQADGEVVAAEAEPVRIAATVPYPLPFATVKPDPRELNVTASTRDSGMKIINLLGDQVRWQEGKARVNVTLGGSLKSPQLTGAMRFSDAVLKVKAIPEPLRLNQTDLRLEGDRLRVAALDGTFDGGTVSAKGALPISPKGALDANQQPLSVRLDQLDLNLPNLYSGLAAGTVTFTNSLLQPRIGGELALTDGRVTVPASKPAGGASQPEEEDSGWQPEFSNFRAKLGPNLNVSRGRLFDFQVGGQLSVNGPLQAPIPKGKLNLERGRVSLWTANFRLDRSWPNTVTFTAANLLDPRLDVRMYTQVLDVTGSSAPASNFSDSAGFESQQNVRVLATVKGPVSELAGERPSPGAVELTSDPARSQDEIVALLGQEALGVDVAQFALSSLLVNIEDTVGGALTLDRLEFSPTASPFGSEFSLGMEAAKDLGTNLSLSAQKNLGDLSTPANINLRYRLSDRWLLRVGGDLDQERRVSIEYQTNF
jgi:translocation and assembly module TamB